MAAPLEQRRGMGLPQHETISLGDLFVQLQSFSRRQRVSGVLLE
jgi:hypothetical protein